MTRINTQPVLEPVTLGPYRLPNRMVMAPLTRARADKGHVPNELMAAYYAQRAGAGLIVSEATSVSGRGHGGPNTPGILNAAQAEGWRRVTAAVHERGGRMFLQLWHMGRQSPASLQPDGGPPVAPSAIPAEEGGVVPRALTTAEVYETIEEHRHGARLALEAGFDGVEIHGANGYLPDQFLHDGSNRREDEFGGSIPNRARFLIEITKAAIGVWGADRVGVRLSPAGTYGGMSDSSPWETYSYALAEVSRLGVAYIHLVEPREGETELTAARLRPLVAGPKLISAGGYTRELANEAVAAGHADLIAFGRWFISNPDLPRRFELGAALNPYDRSTFYAGGERGYVDYPALAV